MYSAGPACLTPGPIPSMHLGDGGSRARSSELLRLLRQYCGTVSLAQTPQPQSRLCFFLPGEALSSAKGDGRTVSLCCPVPMCHYPWSPPTGPFSVSHFPCDCPSNSMQLALLWLHLLTLHDCQCAASTLWLNSAPWRCASWQL